MWRVDRLGRSLIDVLNTVNLLQDRGVALRSLSDGIDPATSTGRLMLNMLATLADYERELITERVNAGVAAARGRGTRFGRPVVEPSVVAGKLEIAEQERAKGHTAEQAAQLVGWSRATLYRHQRAQRDLRLTCQANGYECRPKSTELDINPCGSIQRSPLDPRLLEAERPRQARAWLPA